MLALWEYEWDESDWTGITSAPATTSDAFFGLLLALRWEGTDTPATTTTQDPGAGGGKKKNEYIGPDPDFWDVRERYLRRFVKPQVIKALPALERPQPVPAPIPPVQYTPLEDTATPFILQQQALAAALQRAVSAQNAAELQQAAQRAYKIALDIQKIHQQYYERAIAILLLDVS
jgi:hypothetical protein